MTKPKTHTTNYFDTLIEVAEDTNVAHGHPPAIKADKKTVAYMQYELISNHPYQYTSDDIFFQVFADRNDLTEAEYDQARREYFSKGQPCFRASPLTKTHGFGIHSDAHGKVALYPMESDEYEKLLQDPTIKKVKAMRSSRK